MFDPVTAEFIRQAPALPGLDPASLVDELTAAYVDIAAARLAVGAGPDQTIDLRPLVERMSRLADTFEGQVILDLHPERTRSAAFVAASARQVMAQVGRLIAPEENTTRLDEDVIGAELASALLFLIAERSSDAYEASRDVRAAGEPSPIRRALILAIGRFARGQFEDVAGIDISEEGIGSSDDYGRAANLLYRELLRGLIVLARVGLGLVGAEQIEEAQSLFARVRTLALDEVTGAGVAHDASVAAVSVLAGPHHLAALLMKAGDALRTSMLVRTPTPGGANAEHWKQWLASEARRWPFLWQNHRDAIATGYLNQGASLVMTTPTGSGKTTLAALKIAATLAAGKTVIYLAPTHALVGQVERDLNERIVTLAKAESIENTEIDERVQTLPDLAVVTPERCFALLTFAPELFSDVGLLVFDECHLLGASKQGSSALGTRVDRRAIDAMLCLLTFMSINTTADYLLLSAMVSNAAELADWLNRLLGRPVYPFDDKWKPTRQLRTCVTYDQSNLDALKHSLYPSVANLPLKAVPFGLFSLASGWHPEAPDKLVLRPFAPEPLPLKKGKGFWLTSNRYEVAAAIARRFADAGLKVIVFCESVPMCVSVAKKLNADHGPLESKRDADQDAWRDAVISEVGAVAAIYDAGTAQAAVHHGELLPSERRLVESLFRNRDSGLNIIAATSTLAQGLNLPAEVVILAGTDRLDDSDPEEKTRSALMPHEILNALGRAGRAGLAATGLAVVIPGVPIGCDLTSKEVSDEADLAVIFSEGDQCLPLSDPLTTLFDQIELSGVVGDEAQYLLRRLGYSLKDDSAGSEAFETLARRTFGFHQRFRVHASGAEAWLAQRKATLTAAIASAETPPQQPWQEELSAKTGASAEFIAKLADAFNLAPTGATEAIDWVLWLLGQLDPANDDFDVFLRPDTVARIFGRAYTNQPSLLARRKVALAGVRLALVPWLEAKPLVEIEKAICIFIAANEGLVPRPTSVDSKSKRARRLAIRLAPDLSFVCGVLVQISEKLSIDAGMDPLPMVGFLPQLVRRGYQTPYHFAIGRDLPSASRPEVQVAFDGIADDLARLPTDDWNVVRQKLSTALASSAFTDLTDDDLDEIISAIQTITI